MEYFTWRNKKIRIKTNPDNHFEVQITVAVNLPELFKDFKKTLQCTPLVNKSVMVLEQPKGEYEDEFARMISYRRWNCSMGTRTPQYSPGTPDNDGW